MKSVSNDDYANAFGRWLLSGPRRVKCEWADILGQATLPDLDPESMARGEFRWMINDAGAERIRQINNSPHYVALLRAWAVQLETKEAKWQK